MSKDSRAERAPQPWQTAVCLALSAAIVEQVFHEALHGITALLVGKDWQALYLFATASRWPGTPNAKADVLVAALPAAVNIVTGLLAAAALRNRRVLAGRPNARLWLLYFAAFSLLAGFGYLMIDAAFYKPGGVGDWKKVIGAFGGSWLARGPILALGLGGVGATFFWLPSAVLEFVGTAAGMRRTALVLLLVPFLVVCTVMTALAFAHPLGTKGVILTAMKHWLGYSALAWAPFIAAGMARRHPEAPPEPLVATRPGWAWWALLGVSLAVAGFLALPVDPALIAD